MQEAVARGATVVGTVGSDAKAAAARALGVSRVVNYKAEKLGAVLAAEFPEGVAVAYEGVGGALLKDAVTLTLTLSLTLALSLALTLALTLALALALAKLTLFVGGTSHKKWRSKQASCQLCPTPCPSASPA